MRGEPTLNRVIQTVKERTREFGTRRALGACALDVFLQVISESTVLTVAGCLAGASLSWPLSRFIGQASGLTFVFSGGAVLAAFAAAAVLNIGFAFWPARSAATLDPITALRYE